PAPVSEAPRLYIAGRGRAGVGGVGGRGRTDRRDALPESIAGDRQTWGQQSQAGQVEDGEPDRQYGQKRVDGVGAAVEAAQPAVQRMMVMRDELCHGVFRLCQVATGGASSA